MSDVGKFGLTDKTFEGILRYFEVFWGILRYFEVFWGAIWGLPPQHSQILSNTLKYFQILSNSFKFSLVRFVSLCSLFELFGAFLSFFDVFWCILRWNLRDSASTLSNTLKYSQILSNTLKYSPIFIGAFFVFCSLFFSSFELFWAFLSFFELFWGGIWGILPQDSQIRSNSLKFAQIRSNSLKFSQIFIGAFCVFLFSPVELFLSYFWAIFSDFLVVREREWVKLYIFNSFFRLPMFDHGLGISPTSDITFCQLLFRPPPPPPPPPSFCQSTGTLYIKCWAGTG